MNVKINLDLLRFNVKKDYLPYTYKEEILIQEESKLSDLYIYLANKLFDFGFDKKQVTAMINGVIVYKDVNISILCERFGYEWRLESFAPQATAKDLIVNKALIQQGLKEVEKICPLTQEDYELFDSLLPFCFVTPISKSIEDYLGEGFFIFIMKMIKVHPQQATDLFKLINSPEKGVMNAMLLKDRIFPEIASYDQELLAAQKAVMAGYPLYDSYWVEYTKRLKEGNL